MKIRLGPSRYGDGVFATETIEEGEEILEFAGPVLHRDELPECCERTADRYLQISNDTYLGASGGLDDFVNHSCDPNTGLVYQEDGDSSVGVTLIALRPIEAGEELFFDYSTSMHHEEWSMDCGCGADECRGVVRNFVSLPAERQRFYIKKGIVPEFILLALAPRGESVQEERLAAGAKR